MSGSIAELLDQAVSHGQAGRMKKALDLAREVLASDPNHRQALSVAGAAAFQLGLFAEALPHVEKFAEASLEDAEAHYNLGVVLQALTRLEEATVAFRRAIDLKPDYFEAYNNLGGALLKLSRLEAAADACRSAISISPGGAEAWHNLGMTLAAGEQPDDGIEAFRRAVDLTPDDPNYRGSLGAALLRQGDSAAALDVAEALLQTRPQCANLLAIKVAALVESGRHAAARELLDLDRLILTFKSGFPPAFADLRTFNLALEDHILAHPTLGYISSEKATRNGRQTSELLADPKGPFAQFESMLHAAAERYWASVPTDRAHPFLAYRPKKFRLTVWATVLDRQGHQIPHIHPSAWLSGVYYVKLPSLIERQNPDCEGWIEFGRTLPEFPGTDTPHTRLIRPEEGLLVMFPSYFPHSTVPFDSDEIRISIAFDMTPLTA